MKDGIGKLSVVFISTLLTPHQIPFCNEMYKICNDFVFLQVNHAGEEWSSKGKTIKGKDYPYFQQYSNSALCEQKILEADVVLIGGCDLKLVEKRLKEKKTVFLYLERFYKKGINIQNFIRCIGGTYLHHGRFQKYNVSLLCASAYCAGDAAILGNYKDRTYKWGYFTEFDEMNRTVFKKDNQIIWVGRLIDWKHADDAVKAMVEVVKECPYAVLKIYGDGNEIDKITGLVNSFHLEKNVLIMGAVPAEEVKRQMKQSRIFLSTSDYQEGWGAVLNEAMNSKCAVIASHAAGSTPFLIKDGVNGYIYESGNIQQMADLCVKLLKSPKLQKEMSENAYRTIRDEWNPRQAAERFVKLSEALLAGETTPYLDGPCSKAFPIRQNYMYKYLIGEKRNV